MKPERIEGAISCFVCGTRDTVSLYVPDGDERITWCSCGKVFNHKDEMIYDFRPKTGEAA